MSIVDFCSELDSGIAVFVNKESQEILGDVEAIIHRESLVSDAAVRTFSCEIGLVMVLFYTASECYDSQAQERVLLLLEGKSRREGLWDSQTMAGTVRNIMRLELKRKHFGENEAPQNGMTIRPSDTYEDFHNLTGELGVPNNSICNSIRIRSPAISAPNLNHLPDFCTYGFSFK
jgi:hypothetical protein